MLEGPAIDHGGMTTSNLTQHDRSRAAERAWSALPHGGHDAIQLRIQCAHSHHVATVYATGSGLVYSAPVRARSHGSADLPDEPRGDQHPHRWFDLLAAGEGPSVDDALPAWCDCGARTLSRKALLEWLADGEHRVVVD